MAREYVLNGEEEGKTSSRIKPIYEKLKKELHLTKPLHSSSQPLLAMTETDKFSYSWELYKLRNEELIFIEAYGNQSKFQMNLKIESMNKLNVTIHNERDFTISKIEKIISKF